MPRKLDSDSQISRRLTLRDLHLFLTVVQHGSMARAAAQLGISQPNVSEVIADLEQALDARLFDRRPRGVEPTMYGEALLKRGASQDCALHSATGCCRGAGSLALPPSTSPRLPASCARTWNSALLSG